MTRSSRQLRRRGKPLPVPAKPFPARRMGMSGREEVDLAALATDLQAALQGEVRFDRAARGLYATDSSNYRQVPLGLVLPRTLDDVVLAHRICSRHGAPILNRGGGTSLSGETVNVAVVIDHTKYLHRIGDPDPLRRLITVEPGAINQQVNERAGQVGLVFGPDPSSHGYCSIGGNIGNNSCGVHSVQSQLYGPGPRTSDNVQAMEVVTYEGARFRVGVNEESELERIIAAGGPKGAIYHQLRQLRDRWGSLIRRRYRPVSELPRRVSGYNLDELLPERGFNVARALVGSEGTCATTLEVTLMLTPALLERVTVVVAYEDICQAGDDVPELLEWRPIALEAIDHRLFDEERQEHLHEGGLRELPGQGDHAWLLLQFGADELPAAEDQARRFVDWLVRRKGVARDRIHVARSGPEREGAAAVWSVREAGLGATAFPPDGHDHWPGWEDSAVPPARVGAYLRDLKRLYREFGLQGAIYGHLGQGCIHSRISFDLRHADGLRVYRAFLERAADLVVSYGGSLSGEHGDGQQRAELLEKQYGPELVQAMREFKLIWDPRWKMNPGKVVDPYRLDEHLKLGADYAPAHPPVEFSYPRDGGDFAHATLRCVGVGKCRQPEGVDVMCPSYIVTREEMHTTRGRARLLFEMLQGDVIQDGWQSLEVQEALDLCLGCKGCTSECPVHVDMPTYKAEFLYHHYRSLRRNRSRHMYAFGFVDQAARLAALVPELANVVTQTPGLSRLAKLAAGMDPRRSIPAFAPQTLQAWYRRRGGPRHPAGPRVVLWPDTFSNHFHTEVGVAAVEALEAAGYQVLLPAGHVCCGRPLYDYGFLRVARRYLRRTLRQLRPELRAGTPIVGLEPSCVAVFKDELPQLLPHDEDGARLSRQAFHWAEFLEAHDVPLPRLDREAVVWGHCHQKATGGMQPLARLLQDRVGLRVSEAKGGCCGLAGSWGFEPGKYEISHRCGEVGFFPAVRAAPRDALVIADGFSCRTQLAQSGSDRRALHSAQVIHMAHQHGTSGVRGPLPERAQPPPPAPPLALRVARTAAALAAAAALIAAAGWLFTRRRPG